VDEFLPGEEPAELYTDGGKYSHSLVRHCQLTIS